MRFSTVITTSLLAAFVSADIGAPVKRFEAFGIGRRAAQSGGTICTSAPASGPSGNNAYLTCDAGYACNTDNNCCCSGTATVCSCTGCPTGETLASGMICTTDATGGPVYAPSSDAAGIIGAMGAAAQTSSIAAEASAAVSSITAGAASEVSSLQAAATSAAAAASSAASSATATSTSAQQAPTMTGGAAPQLAVGAPALVLAIFVGILML